MKTNLKHIILALFIAGSVNVFAEVLSPEDAYRRVTEQLPVRLNKAGVTSSVAPQLLCTVNDSDNQAAVYLFGQDGSDFIVVSADDKAPALLGYSDGSSIFDADGNPAFNWWLEEYAHQIEWLRNQSGLTPAPQAADNKTIAPLIKTQWNQRDPYNRKCPIYLSQRCVTGCVATAMSQVMKHHNWPAKGTGSNTYYAESIRQTLKMNFASYPFDWKNMCDIYSTGHSQAQLDAVATLMYAVGVSINMDYSPLTSSARISDAATALIKYFGYSKGILMKRREVYSDTDWEATVYNELANNRPVLYSGQSETSGHTFICDGYNGSRYYHINWGWGGTSDGFFRLSALDPYEQGVGGSSSGYFYDHYIVTDIKPETDATEPVAPHFYGKGFTVSSSSQQERNAQVRLNAYAYIHGGFYNEMRVNLSGFYGLKAIRSNGDVVYLTGFEFSDLKPNYGYNYYSTFLPSTLGGGTYAVSPIVSTDGKTWYDIYIAESNELTHKMIVHDGVAYFSNDVPDFSVPDPYLTEDAAVENIFADEPCADTPTYYNMNGIAVDGNNLAPGLYVRRQGNTVTKIRIQ